MDATHHRTCPLCEAVCGLTLSVRDGKVTRVVGDDADVFSHGFICPKGGTLHHLHEDPDRLRKPLIRRGDDPDSARWDEVSWDEAFAEVERLLTPVLAQHGRDAVALYLGNPNTHNLAGLLYVRPLIKALSTRNLFSASTVDQMPKHVSCGFLFGDVSAIPVPDLERTDLLIMLGANPLESNGSLCTAPDFPGRLAAIRARGGRVVVVDPRRTRTAEHADEHVPIRPGTDAHFLLGMIQVLFEENLVTLGHLDGKLEGVQEVRELARPFTPEAVERVSGVPAERLRALTRALAKTERAAVYGRIGTHTVEFGTLGAWAVDVLNALTGHLDREGGAMWPLPAHAQRRHPGPGPGFRTGRYRSRVKGYPEVRSEFPVATLADEIETAGPEQVRALITVAGNPVLSTPDSKRLARALRGLTCVVSVDPYLNETTRHAHVILPPPSALERSHYDLAFYGLAVRNVAKWSAPVFPASGPSEADILSRLALIAAGRGAQADVNVVHAELESSTLARVARDLAGEMHNTDELSAQLEAEEPVDRLVEILIRSGAYGDRFGRNPDGLTFGKLRAATHGIDLGPLTPRLPELLQTKSGHVELAPAPIAADMARLTVALSAAPVEGLLLVGRRDLRSNNSWMHNVRALVKGPERCTLHIHPEDARARGLNENDLARIRARVGEVVGRVQITDSVMQGVVSLPHGWGHGAKGTRQRVAGEHAGVNTNELTDGARLDPLSGNAVLNAIPVEVTAVAPP
ncbi:MAG TPA: molybdopterin-dependent oxidoreductase [Polyangiales bacterium]